MYQTQLSIGMKILMERDFLFQERVGGCESTVGCRAMKQSEVVVVRECVTYELKMEARGKSRFRSAAVVCLALALSGIIFLGYFCPDQVCALSSARVRPPEPAPDPSAWADNLGRPLDAVAGLSYDDVQNDNFQFDINAHDVMVIILNNLNSLYIAVN